MAWHGCAFEGSYEPPTPPFAEVAWGGGVSGTFMPWR